MSQIPTYHSVTVGAAWDHEARVGAGVLRDGTRGVILSFRQHKDGRFQCFLHPDAARGLLAALESALAEAER
jgi:hypothetical protein